LIAYACTLVQGRLHMQLIYSTKRVNDMKTIENMIKIVIDGIALAMILMFITATAMFITSIYQSATL